MADDLTGACDAACRAAGAGWRVTVRLDEGAPDADVVAVSSDSRDLTRKKAVDASARAARDLLAWGPRIFYKKIDSTLRGHWREETLAVAAVAGAEEIVLCPAFPACGRTVRGGRIFIDGQPGPKIAMPEALILDAETEDDLKRIAASHRHKKVLWAGSAGLARYVFGRRRPVRRRVRLPGAPRWMIITFSPHERTLRQIEWLRDRMHPLDRSSGTLQPGMGLFLVGGNSASHVLKKLRASAIEILGEVESGVAVGTIRGGVADGATVVTKSGAFGDKETIVRVLERLRR